MFGGKTNLVIILILAVAVLAKFTSLAVEQDSPDEKVSYPPKCSDGFKYSGDVINDILHAHAWDSYCSKDGEQTKHLRSIMELYKSLVLKKAEEDSTTRIWESWWNSVVDTIKWIYQWYSVATFPEFDVKLRDWCPVYVVALLTMDKETYWYSVAFFIIMGIFTIVLYWFTSSYASATSYGNRSRISCILKNHKMADNNSKKRKRKNRKRRKQKSSAATTNVTEQQATTSTQHDSDDDMHENPAAETARDEISIDDDDDDDESREVITEDARPSYLIDDDVEAEDEIIGGCYHFYTTRTIPIGRHFGALDDRAEEAARRQTWSQTIRMPESAFETPIAEHTSRAHQSAMSLRKAKRYCRLYHYVRGDNSIE